MKKLLVLMAIMVFAFFVSSVNAQEAAEEAMYGYGAVVSISDTQIVVSEFNYEKDMNEEIVYHIDSSLELDNISAITDIKAADEIDFEYKVVDGNKIITFLSKAEAEDVEVMDQEEVPAIVE